jgi:hypothetical protein
MLMRARHDATQRDAARYAAYGAAFEALRHTSLLMLAPRYFAAIIDGCRFRRCRCH